MAQLMPFSAVHFNPSIIGDDFGDVIAPPYDVVDAEEGKRLLDRHPYNAVRLELTIPVPGDPDAAKRYEDAASSWAAWRQAGILVEDEQPGLYLHEHEFVHDGTRFVRTAVMGLLRLPAPTEEKETSGLQRATGVIPHEETLPQPKEDRFRLLCACRAQFSPVLALYEDGDGVVADTLRAARRSAQPDIYAATGGELLRVWRVADPAAVDRIVRVIAAGPAVIADGHHRCESMRRFAAYVGRPERARVLAALVSATDPGVVVLPTHRVVAGWSADAVARILERARAAFVVTGAPSLVSVARLDDAQKWWARLSPLVRSRDGSTSLVAVSREGAWVLSHPGETAEALRLLDTILGEAEAGPRGISSEPACGVTYTRDAPAALEGIASGRVQVAFFPPAIPAGHVLKRAREGYLFPRKTTYFQPKAPAGLLMYDLDD